jgi:Fuc2NAc and GlcNAc transferase
MTVAALVTLAAFCVALSTTPWIIKSALRRRILDVPSARSSHKTVMPRGGGLAIVIATTVGLIALWLVFAGNPRGVLALAIGGVTVAAIGFADDLKPVAPWFRLLVHFAAASLAVVTIGGMPPLQIGDTTTDLGWIGDAAAVLGVVWSLNLFNFMDGIDGIAASEAAFIALASATIATISGGMTDNTRQTVVFGAACLGFLYWNWPPARIFMGDVGSGYLGFMLAVFALLATQSDPGALYVWLTLAAIFFVDATITLLRRLIARQPVHVAHRTHGYQHLALNWGSHRRVTVLVLAVNVLWLFPLAAACRFFPAYAPLFVVIAAVPLAIATIALGAGTEETRERKPTPRAE